MSTFVSLGSRVATAAVDTGAYNPGNWTVTFDPNTMNCNIPYFEISHIVINGIPNSTFKIFVDSVQWDYVQNGNINSWDPAVPIPVKPGQYVYFYWDEPASGTPVPTSAPMVTVWLRYDQDITANSNNQFNQGLS